MAGVDAQDERFLRHAIELARQAREAGGDPFGAMLVENGRILAECRDRSVEMSDPTYHAELSAISEYCRASKRFSLKGCTLYASSEPCPMCAGAIHWARISRLVYSVPQAAIQARSGGRPKPDCESIVNLGGHRQADVIGGVLLDEGLRVFDGWEFIPKAERHRQSL